MPNVSQAQRGAMAAAAAGNSTLGIPQSVGKDFMNADTGGHLPAHAPAKEGKPDKNAESHAADTSGKMPTRKVSKAAKRYSKKTVVPGK